MWSIFWLFVWLLAGVFIAIQVLSWLDTERWQAIVGTVQGIDSVETAVRVIGTLFAATWGVHLLNRLPFIRGALISRLGFTAGTPNLLQLVTFSFVHGNDNHLFSNTRDLLIFGGVMAMLVPSMQAFIVGSLVVLLIAAVGFLIYERKDAPIVGASCVLMGYFSFDLVYGFFALGIGGTITAWIMLILFGRKIWGVLRFRAEGVSHIAHIWGFIGGVFSAAALVRLGFV
ncbi:MAG: rhomboid family intramembrane serine protease [Chloroflexota bacterium]